MALALGLGILCVGANATNLSDDGQITVLVQEITHESIQMRSPDEQGGERTYNYILLIGDTKFASFTVNFKFTYSSQLGYAQIYSKKLSNIKSFNGYQALVTFDGLHASGEDEICVMAGYLDSDGAVKPPAHFYYSVNSSGVVSDVITANGIIIG